MSHPEQPIIPGEPTPTSIPTARQEDILLYWSGELEPSEAARIAELLATDLEAKAYYDELQTLRSSFAELPTYAPASPVLVSTLADPVAGRPHVADPVKLAPPRAPLVWILGGLVAAAVALVLIVPQAFSPSNPPDLPPAFTKASQGVDASSENAAKVSNILFSSRTLQTRRLDHRQERHHFNRERDRSLASRY